MLSCQPLFTSLRFNKGIRGYVSFSRDVPDLVVILLEIGMAVSGSSVEVSWGFPVLEVGMIGKDGEGMLSPTQVVPPMGKHFHHSKQLSLIDVVITFCRGKSGGIIGDRMEFRFPFFV